MTETDDRRTDDREKKRTVKDIDHTHPHTDVPFGSRGVYNRGGSPADDEAVEADPDDEGATDRDARTDGTGGRRERRRVKDLDHTPPDDVGAQRTFNRGEETPVDPVARTDDHEDGD